MMAARGTMVTADNVGQFDSRHPRFLCTAKINGEVLQSETEAETA